MFLNFIEYGNEPDWRFVRASRWNEFECPLNLQKQKILDLCYP